MSGLLGIGGAIVIVPTLLYVPQWLGVAVVDVKTATAIAVSQVVAAACTGALAHGRQGLVHRRLAVAMSVVSAAGAFTGGIASAYLPGPVLLGIAAALASSAAVLMVVPPPTEKLAGPSHPAFSLVRALPAGFAIGCLIGMIGIGSFLMVPTMIYLLAMPTRVGMATVLAVAFPTALAGFAGKLITGQIPLLQAGAIVVGAIPGAQLGSMLSARVPARALRLMYGAVVLTVSAGLWYDLLNTP
jgi:uncharacterized protein